MNEQQHIRQQLDTVGDCVRWTRDCFEAADIFYGHGTDNSWDEALHLVLGGLRLSLEADPSILDCVVADQEKQRVIELARRRVEERIPVPYLTGRAWFAGLEFVIDPRAIIPRSPIAELIETEFVPWYPGTSPHRVLDMCCGSGCIGLAIAAWLPEARVDLLDISAEALALAAENAQRLGLEERVEIVESDMFAAVRGKQYDLIVTNPPYVDVNDLLAMPAEYRHEPALALGSGKDGLEAVTVLKAGPNKGAILTFLEKSNKGGRERSGWLIKKGKATELTIADVGGFEITDATSLANGEVLLLERRFRWSEGVKMRLRLIDANDLKAGAQITGEILLAADMNQQIDNMEGVSAHQNKKGETIITLISDDNFNRLLQRTVLLQFALKPPKRAKSTAQTARGGTPRN